MNRNAEQVLAHRYLLKDAAGRVVEGPEQMFARVARAVAAADRAHEGERVGAEWEERYRAAMTALRFLPNSPTLMNAGTPLGQLAACFVLPVPDSIPGIFGAVRDAALIHQSGGGTGFSFSRLRPSGSAVRETGGVASGPVSFMRVFDTATEVVRQGGRRRGANMGVLDVSHPDVLEFVHAKDDPGVLTRFNLSVAVSDVFMAAAADHGVWPLAAPRDGAVGRRVSARELWRSMAHAAWRHGDPGLLFSDTIERANPTPALGRLEATNPCGEQPLLPYEACTLGSIELGRLVGKAGFDWDALDELATLGTRFLDGVLDVSRWPLPEIERMVRATRKIGLGVMGLADALERLAIPYASAEAAAFAAHVAERVAHAARRESVRLAERRGSFPAFAASVWPARGFERLRNATVTTVAPTGTLAILAGTTSGIEPRFALAYVRRALDGSELPEVDPVFVAELERRGLDVDGIVARVAETGTLAAMEGLPPDLIPRFMTARDVSPEWHVRLQAAVQEHTDNAVSKTVLLPHEATVEQVEETFLLAWRLGCKGITVYREGCRPGAVLESRPVPGFAIEEARARAQAEFTGECRVCSV